MSKTMSNAGSTFKSSYARCRPHHGNEKTLLVISTCVRGRKAFSGGSVESFEIERLKRSLNHPMFAVREHARRSLLAIQNKS